MMDNVRPVGLQLMAELLDCNQALLNDPEQIKGIMLKAAQESGAEIIGSMFHHFEPQGVSGVVMIAESHLTIHTWPELAYAAVDIFTCGRQTNPRKALAYLTGELEAKETNSMEVNRGMNIRARPHLVR